MSKVFTVQPTGQTISLNPGEEFYGKITITNPVDATEDFDYTVSVAPYSVGGTDYTANLAEVNNHTAIANWITIEQSDGTVAPNETKEINFTVKVPENAPAGGQYAAILVSEKKTKQNNAGFSIQNIMEIGSIIYADVAGETMHDTTIVKNTLPFFAFTAPILLNSELKNDGNVHEMATYDIKLSNALTGEMIFPAAGNNDNIFSEVIMPETTRVVEREVDTLPMVGVVHVSQSIDFAGEISVAETNLVICPAWLLIITIATIALIIWFVVSQIREYKARKRKKTG